MNGEQADPAPPFPRGVDLAPPGARAARIDRWAHRRGEPRVFALAWTIFLFAATLATFVAAQSASGGDRGLVRAAAQMLVFASALGVTVLWPMVRLSQWPDGRPVWGSLRDLVVLLVPLQAMLWPQAMWWLARWPAPVIVALDLLLLCWGVLVGGLLAWCQALRLRALRDPDPARAWGPARSAGAMVLFVLLAGAGAAGALGGGPLLTGGDLTPPAWRPGWMLSPLTGVFEITRDRTWSGDIARVAPGHLWLMLAAGVCGLPAWLMAWRIGRGSGRAVGLR